MSIAPQSYVLSKPSRVAELDAGARARRARRNMARTRDTTSRGLKHMSWRPDGMCAVGWPAHRLWHPGRDLQALRRQAELPCRRPRAGNRAVLGGGLIPTWSRI